MKDCFNCGKPVEPNIFGNVLCKACYKGKILISLDMSGKEFSRAIKALDNRNKNNSIEFNLHEFIKETFFEHIYDFDKPELWHETRADFKYCPTYEKSTPTTKICDNCKKPKN